MWKTSSVGLFVFVAACGPVSVVAPTSDTAQPLEVASSAPREVASADTTKPEPPPAPKKALAPVNAFTFPTFLNDFEVVPPATSAWNNASTAAAQKPVVLSKDDALSAAKAICESDSVKGTGLSFNCASCPSYTDLAKVPSGMKVTLLPGDYSAPGRVEVVAELMGCDTGAGSGQSYGSRALLQKTPEGWKRTYFAMGSLGFCSSIVSKAGRTRLLCHTKGGHMGLFEEALVFTGFDDASPLESVAKPRPVASLVLGFWTHDVRTLRISNKDPINVITLEHFDVSGAADYEAGNESALQVRTDGRSLVDCDGGPSKCPSIDTESVEHSLHFRFDGTDFQIAPEDRASYQRLLSRNHE